MKKIVDDYIASYNSFDIDGMMANMDKDICFQNVSNNIINMETKGLDEFAQAARQAKEIFSARKQKSTNYSFEGNMVVVSIDYEGEVAIDLPNGLKKGEVINLKGKSEFYFNDSKIVKLVDIS